MGQYTNVTGLKGRKTVVRNGYLPEREVLAGLRLIEIRIPKIRDRSGGEVKLNLAIVPPYVRKAKRAEASLPWLYENELYKRNTLGQKISMKFTQ